MALNGTGKGSRPVHNSKGATSHKVKFSSTGGSIAKNNTGFNDGTAKKAMPGVGSGISSKGEVITNPQFDSVKNTGRPKGAAMKTKTKLPSGMTQQSSTKIPIKSNAFKQPTQRVNTMRGAADSTVGNLKSYIARKAKGEVR